MKFSLSALVRRARNPRRSQIVLRPIAVPGTFATSLYRDVYWPVLQVWERAIPRILAQYERTVAALTTDAPADVEAEIGGAQSEVQRLLMVLTPRLRAWAVRVERFTRNRWRGAVLSASSVDLLTMLGPEDVRETVEETIAWNTSLIRDVSAQAQQRISNAVFTGLRERKPAREVAKEIRESVAMSRRRSINIAADQLQKLTSSLAAERRRQAGIDKWKWRHSGKLHPREEHLARNGKVYTDETAPADKPGQLPFCGCREQAVVEFD